MVTYQEKSSRLGHHMMKQTTRAFASWAFSNQIQSNTLTLLVQENRDMINIAYMDKTNVLSCMRLLHYIVPENSAQKLIQIRDQEVKTSPS